LPETQALYGFLIAVLLLVGGGIVGAARTGIDTPVGVIAIGASIAVGLSALSAIGQGIAAAGGIGAVAERKEMFGKSIIFSIIPETQALMGFLIAILVLIGSGVIGAAKAGLTIPMGLVTVGAGLAVGLAAISAIGQGSVITSGIAAVTRDGKMFGKSLLFGVLPQTQALYGFLIAILLLVGGGIIGTTKEGLTTAIGLVAIGAGCAVGLGAISAIGQGLAAAAGVTAAARDKKMFGKSILFSVLPETQALYGFLIAILLLVGGGLMGAIAGGISLPVGLVALAAGLAVGLAAVSAVGQGTVAAAGIAATVEKPKTFGKSILFSVLPETQALYGFLIAVLLLVGGGLMGAINVGLTTPMGIVALGAAFSVGLAALSAIGQGMAAASGVSSLTENSEMFGKSIIFSIIPETQALMGFLIAILILIGSGLMGAAKLALNSAMGVVAIGAGLAVGLAALSAVGQGFVVSSGIAAVTKDKKMFGKSLLFGVLPQTQALYGFLIAILLLVGGGIVGAVKPGLEMPVGLLAMGAGLAVGLAAISAVGQGLVAASAVNVVGQKSRMFGKSILFSVLPETQALYGFLVAVLLLVGGGLVGTLKAGLTVPAGLVAVGAGISIGIAAISAIGQGLAASSAVGSVAEKEKMFGRGILFSVLPETQALYGIIIAILLMTGVGLLGVLQEGITFKMGLGAIGIGLTMGFAAISAIGQGVVAGGAVGANLRDEKSMGKGLVLSVIPETYAIFGLLISILMLLGLQLI
jgi:V/A-type H+-transporting ATPase subunit K